MVIVRKSFESDGPKLYVCSTPIGNLNDVTQRLLEVLRSVDVLAAEDTRQTRKLLSKFDIHVPRLISCHQHNEASRLDEFRALWQEGKSIAVVSDAGTPGVSDPGEHVIDLAIEQGVPVIPVPGPSAVLAALVSSGLPISPFAFIGFLPRENKLCMEALYRYQTFQGVLAFYEAPHRLLTTLGRICEVYPTCRGVLAKELTKKHETFIYGSTDELLDYVRTEEVRGEYVILIDARSAVSNKESKNGEGELDAKEVSLEQAIIQVRNLIESGISHTDAVKRISQETGIKKRILYNETVLP